MKENLPVVNVGNREHPRYLPSEACQVLPGQPFGKKLSPGATRSMIEFACRQPKANANSIMTEGRNILCLDPPKNGGLVSLLWFRAVEF
jgi:eukaryotic translation initiation factor 2C